jgi:hypothetical protein
MARVLIAILAITASIGSVIAIGYFHLTPDVLLTVGEWLDAAKELLFKIAVFLSAAVFVVKLIRHEIDKGSGGPPTAPTGQ